MIDSINDKTMEFSQQGGLAVGGFSWALHFTWRSLPERERKRRQTEADPARYNKWLFVVVYLFDLYFLWLQIENIVI